MKVLAIWLTDEEVDDLYRGKNVSIKDPINGVDILDLKPPLHRRISFID